MNLTPREREVLALAIKGLKNSKIGSRLNIKEGTVKFHMRNIYKTYGVTRKPELFAKLLNNK